MRQLSFYCGCSELKPQASNNPPPSLSSRHAQLPIFFRRFTSGGWGPRRLTLQLADSRLSKAVRLPIITHFLHRGWSFGKFPEDLVFGYDGVPKHKKSVTSEKNSEVKVILNAISVLSRYLSAGQHRYPVTVLCGEKRKKGIRHYICSQ